MVAVGIGGLALVAIAIHFAARFFRALHEIILSVDKGEPFAPANADLGLDPAAILLILVLFILARVFECCAAMETDLEGTG